MSDTLLSTASMSNDRQRIRQIKHHLKLLKFELHLIESYNHRQPLDTSINSQLTTLLSYEENLFPILPCKKPKAGRLHSTTNNEYRKKSKKSLFAASARATSTPKSSPRQNKISLKPYHTSTPRRSHRHSTALDIQANNNFPVQCILYDKDYEKRQQHKCRHSAVPFSKRSILPRLHQIEENAQWI
jgi:hypothetical protein